MAGKAKMKVGKRMLGKRGDTTLWTFLLGLLITVLILLPFGLFAYNYFNQEQKIKDSFNGLIEDLKKLEDGEKGSRLLYFSDKHLIVSYDKDEVSRKSCGGDLGGFYKKTEISQYCQDNCLCLCKSSGWLGTGVGTDFDKGECSYCIDFKDWAYKPDFYYGGEDCEGAVYIRGTTALSLQFERKLDVIGLCNNMPCLDKEINRVTAEKEFLSFLATAEDCMEVKDECLCQMEDLREGFALQFEDSKIGLNKENAGVIKWEQFNGKIVNEADESIQKILYAEEMLTGYEAYGETAVPEYYTGWLADGKQIVKYLYKAADGKFKVIEAEKYGVYKDIKNCPEILTTKELVPADESSSAEEGEDEISEGG